MHFAQERIPPGTIPDCVYEVIEVCPGSKAKSCTLSFFGLISVSSVEVNTKVRLPKAPVLFKISFKVGGSLVYMSS